MPLGTAQMTVTTQANFIPELWQGIIPATERKLVLKNLVWDWSPEEPTDTIRYPNVSNLTANAKAANTQVTLNAPTETMVTLNVNRHDEVSFLLEDITKVQSSFNLMSIYTKKTAYALAQQIDTRLSDLVSGFSQIVGAAGVDIGDVQIRDAVEFLDLADADLEDRALVIYPTQRNALFAIEKYFRADIKGNGENTVVSGKIGEIYGVPVFVTTNLGTSANARLNTMFHKEALASAILTGPRTQGAYIHEYLGHLVISDAIYGEVEARDDHGVWIQS